MPSLAMQQPDIGILDVPNPHGLIVPDMVKKRSGWHIRENTVTAPRQLRDDPLGQMHDRRQINLAQYRAGRLWQADYESASIGAIRSQDPSVEPVDGGGHIPEGINDRQLKAMKNLDRWRRVLGKDGADIVEDVLARKFSIRQVAAFRYGMLTKASLTYTGHRFRECLTTLAEKMGLA